MKLLETGLNQIHIYPSMLNCCVEYPYWKARIRQKHNEIYVQFPIIASQDITLSVSSIITFSFTIVDNLIQQDLPNSIVYYKDWEGEIDIYNVADYDVDLMTIETCPCYSDVTSRFISNSVNTTHYKNPFHC